MMLRKTPLAATKLMILPVREACERIAPLQKQTAFDEFFFKGARKAGEAVQDYISRRETEYERMKTLSTGTTMSMKTCGRTSSPSWQTSPLRNRGPS